MDKLSNAIRLLESMGGDKDIRTVLITMQETQHHNEHLLLEATKQRKEAIALRDEADKTLRVVSQSKEKVSYDLEKLTIRTDQSKRDMAGREASVNAKLADLERKTQAQKADSEKVGNELTKKTTALAKRETAHEEKEAILAVVEKEYTEIDKLIRKSAKWRG